MPLQDHHHYGWHSVSLVLSGSLMNDITWTDEAGRRVREHWSHQDRQSLFEKERQMLMASKNTWLFAMHWELGEFWACARVHLVLAYHWTTPQNSNLELGCQQSCYENVMHMPTCPVDRITATECVIQHLAREIETVREQGQSIFVDSKTSHNYRTTLVQQGAIPLMTTSASDLLTCLLYRCARFHLTRELFPAVQSGLVVLFALFCPAEFRKVHENSFSHQESTNQCCCSKQTWISHFKCWGFCL